MNVSASGQSVLIKSTMVVRFCSDAPSHMFSSPRNTPITEPSWIFGCRFA